MWCFASQHPDANRNISGIIANACGTAAVLDYELLELVLFWAIPCQDVKALARQLLERFGDFNHVVLASMRQLSAVRGCGRR